MAKRCENGDGPGDFEGFGHTFCWHCYSRFMETFQVGAREQQQQPGDQKQLKLF
jgi:hypothetical protein